MQCESVSKYEVRSPTAIFLTEEIGIRDRSVLIMYFLFMVYNFFNPVKLIYTYTSNAR
jgi:hypothetical protein